MERNGFDIVFVCSVYRWIHAKSIRLNMWDDIVLESVRRGLIHIHIPISRNNKF